VMVSMAMLAPLVDRRLERTLAGSWLPSQDLVTIGALDRLEQPPHGIFDRGPKTARLGTPSVVGYSCRHFPGGVNP
jgi:hypothetical protein